VVWTKRISFTLWPVGQGLFTLVDTQVSSKSHRIVYDCGTSCPNQHLTAQAFTAMRNRSVDLLVVSHFHWDHISGIPQLFKSVPEVKEVWIPYLSAEQRLLFAFSTAVDGMLSGSDEADVLEVTLLASGGAGWFASRGSSVQEVGGPPPSAPDFPDPIPPDEPLMGDSDHELPLGAGDENPVPPRDLRLSPLRSFPDAFIPLSNFRAYRSDLKAVGSDGVSVAEAPVELLTWILPITDARTTELLEKLSAWLQTLGESVTVEGLMDASTDQVNTVALVSLVKALGKKANRSQLRDMYLELNGDLNVGTLFLLVHPTQINARYRCRHNLIRELRSFRRLIIENAFGPGVLLTGDAPTRVLKELLDNGTDRLTKRLQQVLFHQVPHHGSLSSLYEPWVEHIGSRWMYGWHPISVVSCGRSNHYGHPHPRVMWEYDGEVVSEGSQEFEGSFEWL